MTTECYSVQIVCDMIFLFFSVLSYWLFIFFVSQITRHPCTLARFEVFGSVFLFVQTPSFVRDTFVVIFFSIQNVEDVILLRTSNSNYLTPISVSLYRTDLRFSHFVSFF